MTAQNPTRTAPPTSRRAGYVATAVVDLVLLYLVNEWPGWQSLPFLTDGMTDVLGLVNLSLVAPLVVNLVWLLYDPAWFTAACQVGLSVVSLAVSIALLRVFPFDFSAYAFDWALLTTVVLWVAVLGSSVSIVVWFVRLVRAVVAPTARV